MNINSKYIISKLSLQILGESCCKVNVKTALRFISFPALAIA